KMAPLPNSGEADETRLTASMLTEAGVAMGTVAYMSPEQARGEELDARSDLFSFGVMLYEMVTGLRPFQGSTTALQFDAILNRDPTPVRTLRPDVPRRVEEIVEAALRKDRRVRLQSADEVLKMLTATKQVPENSSQRERKLRRMPLVAAAVVIMVVFSALVYW